MSTNAAPTDKPTDQRPEHPDFWCKRFGSGATPWDACGVPAELREFAENEPSPLATLIPGCGSAWEAAWLAARGWPVTAIDFSPVAIDKARTILDGHTVELVCADFFSFSPPRPPQVIYERAFLCALPRKLWNDWAASMAAQLPAGGRLLGYFFVTEQLKGPPFGIPQAELDALLARHFECIEDKPASNSVPVFAGRERWQQWRRRD